MDGTDEGWSEDDLAAWALTADADAPIDDDAVPFGADDAGAALLPEWYMPARLRPGATPRSSRRRAWAVGMIVAALVVVNGAGLCVTYGFPEIAW